MLNRFSLLAIVVNQAPYDLKMCSSMYEVRRKHPSRPVTNWRSRLMKLYCIRTTSKINICSGDGLVRKRQESYGGKGIGSLVLGEWMCGRME